MPRGRRRYVAAYDIADAKRLRAVHRIMKEFGWAMQYSVFICDLDEIEITELKLRIGAVIHHSADRVALIDLGQPEDRGVSCFQFMGVHTRLPTSGPVVL